MFGMSFGELLIVGVVALLVFGPEKLPELFRNVGRWSGELKRTSDSLRREFYNAVYTPAEELKALERETRSLVAMNEEEIVKSPLCPDSSKTSPSSDEPSPAPKVMSDAKKNEEDI